MARNALQPVNFNGAAIVGGVFPTTTSLTTASPSVPASGTPQTNTNAWGVSVNVTGGTVTVVSVNGVATGQTSGYVFVNAGGTITLTYSVAPTWAWAAAGLDLIGAGGATALAGAWTAGPGGAAAVPQGVQFLGNGLQALWFQNGAQVCTASHLIGQKVQGDTFPFAQDQATLAANSNGWLGPWSPVKYNQTDSSQFGSAPGGVIGAGGVGQTCIDFSDVRTLSVRLYQLIPVSP